MSWDDTFIYQVSKVTSAQMNAIIAKIKSILAEDIIFADSTTGDVSTTKHGYFPKIPGGSGFLRADGQWAATGAGDITGSTGSTDKALLRANGTGGATFQGSTVTVDDTGNVNIPTGKKYKINNTALAYTDITGAGTVTATAGALTLNGIVGGAGTTDTKIITDLPTATTIGGAYAYRAGGTDVPYTDGGTGLSTYPKRTIFLSCAGGNSSTTTGDSGGSTTETSTYKNEFRGVSFAAGTTTAYHFWNMVMPLNWDGGTVVATPVFLPVTSNASNHTIIFGLQGIALASTGTRDTAYGNAQESTYTVAADQSAAIIFGPATSALTVGGAPAGGTFVTWRTYRKGATDTYTGAVILLGWKVVYQTNGTSDE